MKYVYAFTPCLNNRKGDWQTQQAPDGGLFSYYGNHNLFMPFHPMWTDGNHYDTHCLTANELSEYKRFNKLAGFPKPIVGESFDAYQMDFWSAGTQYRHSEELS